MPMTSTRERQPDHFERAERLRRAALGRDDQRRQADAEDDQQRDFRRWVPPLQQQHAEDRGDAEPGRDAGLHEEQRQVAAGEEREEEPGDLAAHAYQVCLVAREAEQKPWM